jgi:dolichol-phosphate mannosyltransferase
MYLKEQEMSPKLISIVIPIYNEEKLIAELYRRLCSAIDMFPDKYRYELIFVNDGSKDRSLQFLRDFQREDERIRIVDFARNFGHQKAITAGVDFAAGDAIVVMDGDLQDPPETISNFIKKWEEGYHVVYGVRTKREGETHFKLWTASLFYRMLSSLSEVEIPLDAGDFRLIDRRVALQLRNVREENRYIRGIVSWLGFKQIGVQYARDQRYAGETKYTLRKMLRFAIDGVTSFSEKPLFLSSYLGLLVATFSIAWGIWIIVQRILGISETILGWSSIIVAVLFLGGVQLCCIGILGQYLGRIYGQIKQRPLYIVGDLYGFSSQPESHSSHPSLQPREVYQADHTVYS